MFGVARCMVASNFPVDGLKAITADMPRADRLRLFHGTAAETYRLQA